jgi:tyrosyl-tRNA synthetase
MLELLFINCTRIPLSEKGGLMALGPREAKGKIAFEIVKKFYGEKKAAAAQDAFVSQFSKGELPKDIKEESMAFGTEMSANVVAGVMSMSKSEVRRLMEQGGVKIDGKVIKEDESIIIDENPKLIQVGKRKFVKIIGKK